MQNSVEFQAELNGDKNILGSLVFENDGISFYENFALTRPLELKFPAGEILAINFVDVEKEIYQPSIWRIFFLKELAFGKPKNWNQDSCRVEVEMNDGSLYYFTIKETSAINVRTRVNRLVSGYFQ